MSDMKSGRGYFSELQNITDFSLFVVSLRIFLAYNTTYIIFFYYFKAQYICQKSSLYANHFASKKFVLL